MPIYCHISLHGIGGKIEGRLEVRGDEEEDVSSYWMTLTL
jgi:hypothetical protein